MIFTASQQVQVRQHIDVKHEGVGHYCDVCDYSAALATSVRIHKLRVYNVLVLQTWESCIYSSKEPGLYKVADKVFRPAQGASEPGNLCDGGAKAEHHLGRVYCIMWQECLPTKSQPTSK